MKIQRKITRAVSGAIVVFLGITSITFPKTEAQAEGAEQPARPIAASEPAARGATNSLAVPRERGSPPIEVASARRPRRLAEVRKQAQRLRHLAVGLTGNLPELDELAPEAPVTVFTAYDTTLIAAIQQRWHDLRRQHRGLPRTGKVVVEFKLYSDGHISDLKVSSGQEGSVEASLCRQAVADLVPYAPWPVALRRLVEGDTRAMTLTFWGVEPSLVEMPTSAPQRMLLSGRSPRRWPGEIFGLCSGVDAPLWTSPWWHQCGWDSARRHRQPDCDWLRTSLPAGFPEIKCPDLPVAPAGNR